MQATARGVRRYALRLAAACVFCLGTLQGLAGTMRVMSLNAEWLPGRVPEPAPAERARHLVSIQRMLHEVNPDIWLVQEVVQPEALPTALAVLPDVKVHTASRFADSPHQLAIAARLPTRKARSVAWPADRGGVAPPRGMAFSAIELPDASLLLVFTLHLKSNFRGVADYDAVSNVAMRESAARHFLNYVRTVRRSFRNHPVRGVLLGGDLNVMHPQSVFSGERTIPILETGGFEHLGSDGVDHFWGIGIGEAEFRILTDYRVSDHRPILLDMRLPDGITLTRALPLALGEAARLAGSVRTDINTASLSELRSLPGIGVVLSTRIVEARPFASVEDLMDVHGIGPVKMEWIRPYVTTGALASAGDE